MSKATWERYRKAEIRRTWRCLLIALAIVGAARVASGIFVWCYSP